MPFTKTASQYSGLYLFTTPARMMRPLLNIAAGKPEMVGTFEQVVYSVFIELYFAQNTATAFIMSNSDNLFPLLSRCIWTLQSFQRKSMMG